MMKKILSIFAFSITSSIFAASVSWESDCLPQTFEGGTAYLVYSTDVSLTQNYIFEALKNDGIASTLPYSYEVLDFATLKEDTDYFGYSALGNTGVAAPVNGQYAGQTTGSIFIVNLSADKKTFSVSEVISGTNVSSFELSAGLDENYDPIADYWTATTGKVAAVPEPTVLALLALGVAGVALRRKKVVA